MPIEREHAIVFLLIVAALAYLAFVSRTRQRYVGSFALDAPIREVWDLVHMRPGAPIWVPGVKAVSWVDEERGEFVAVFDAGHELHCRVVSESIPEASRTEFRYWWKGENEYGDLFRNEYRLTEENGRTLVSGDMSIERGPLFNGFWMRLNYPFTLSAFASLARQELIKRHGEPAPGGNGGAAGLKGSLIRAGLALGTVAWLVFDLGWSIGLALLIMLVVHEYGHVWAMRRHGHTTAQLYLLPFFGGVALGSKMLASDAEAAEIFLMGPVFGLLPGLACLIGFELTDDLWFAATAGFLVLVNLVNLAPASPLDGGRIVQALLRPAGEKVWFVLSGLLIVAGAAVAYATLRSPLILLVFALGALAWSLAPTPPPAVRPLSRGGIALVAAAYLGLSAVHGAILLYILSTEDWDDLFDAYVSGPQFLG